MYRTVLQGLSCDNIIRIYIIERLACCQAFVPIILLLFCEQNMKENLWKYNKTEREILQNIFVDYIY